MTDDTHGQTYDEAVNETLEDGVVALTALNEIVDEILDEMMVGDAQTRAAGEVALDCLLPAQRELAEALEDLAETSEKDPFERLSDRQLARFLEMYGPLPDE